VTSDVPDVPVIPAESLDAHPGHRGTTVIRIDVRVDAFAVNSSLAARRSP